MSDEENKNNNNGTKRNETKILVSRQQQSNQNNNINGDRDFIICLLHTVKLHRDNGLILSQIVIEKNVCVYAPPPPLSFFVTHSSILYLSIYRCVSLALCVFV